MPASCSFADSIENLTQARSHDSDLLRDFAGLRQGTFQVQIENPGIDEIDDHIDKATNRIAVGSSSWAASSAPP